MATRLSRFAHSLKTTHTPGDTETTKFCDRGTSASNNRGNVISKVKSWAEDMELEGNTIRAVRHQMPCSRSHLLLARSCLGPLLPPLETVIRRDS